MLSYYMHALTMLLLVLWSYYTYALTTLLLCYRSGDCSNGVADMTRKPVMTPLVLVLHNMGLLDPAYDYIDFGTPVSSLSGG